MVFQHIPDLQVLYTDQLVFLDQSSGDFVQIVLADICYLFVYPGNDDSLLIAIITAFCLMILSILVDTLNSYKEDSYAAIISFALARIFLAAFTSLSWLCPHTGQYHARTARFFVSLF